MKQARDGRVKACLVFPNIYLGIPLNINTPIHPPLGLAYLAAVLREDGNQVKVIDAAAENIGLNNLAGRVKQFNPHFIGITTNIANSRKAILTARYLRGAIPECIIVMGGPWASVEYEMLLEDNIADVVVIGEGERTIVELAKHVNDKERWKQIQGLVFSTGDNPVFKTEPRPFIEDLDSLPFPAWDLFPSSRKYHFIHRRAPFYPIMTTRGCPYDCIHCTKLVHGYKYRKRSMKNVLSEIRYLVDNFGTREVFIIDDSFNLDMARAEKILDEIIRQDFNLMIKFTNGIRADRITPRLGKKLKAAGTYAASLGIESGCQEIVHAIGKGLNLRAVIKAVKILHENGMIVGGFFILGHPMDDFNSMMKTIDFAIALDLDYPQFFKSLPFPGTKMYDLIRKHGTFLDDGRALDGYSINTVNFSIWELHPEDIQRAFRFSYKAFYLRPVKILKLLLQYRSLTEFWWFIKSTIGVFLGNLF
ncbi:radical SAM protein [Candidatus Bathyarchaeota archaeon]|nr:radical SAM protein [Candidatus Bathyarchaeota archaeon]